MKETFDCSFSASVLMDCPSLPFQASFFSLALLKHLLYGVFGIVTRLYWKAILICV